MSPAPPRLGLQRQPAAQRLDTVAYLSNGVAERRGAVLGDLEPDNVVFDTYIDRRSRTLAGALEHLETAEVHCPRDLGRIARLRRDLDARRNVGAHCRRT